MRNTFGHPDLLHRTLRCPYVPESVRCIVYISQTRAALLLVHLYCNVVFVWECVVAGGGADDKRDTAEWNSWLASFMHYTCTCVYIERQRHNKQVNYHPGQLFFSKTRRRAALGWIQTHDTLQSRLSAQLPGTLTFESSTQYIQHKGKPLTTAYTLSDTT